MEEPSNPLLHASAAGDATEVLALVRSGADARLRRSSDGLNAISLAAMSGHVSVLGALRSVDPSLLREADKYGRTALHWAVASRDTCAVKYLLGRCGASADLGVADAVGDTPLHLFDGPPEIMLLLLYGDDVCAASRAAALAARNQSGQTPVEKAAAKQKTPVAQAEAWLKSLQATHDAAGASFDRRLFAFLPTSPLRPRPVVAPPSGGAWCAELRPPHALLWVGGTLTILSTCVAPTTTVRVSTAAYMAAGLVVAALGATRRCVRWLRRDALGPPFPALFVLSSLLALLALYARYVLPQHFAIVSPLAALLWAALAAATLITYAALLRLDPGNLAFTAAERAAAADGYWAAVEARVWGDPLQRAFCHRTEGPRPPRSKFSPLARALVACHDHDCVWVHRAIGAGNHRTFVAFLAAGAATIALSLGTLAHAHAAGALGELIPEAAASPVLFRVALWAVADALLLLLFLGYLLRHQVLCISRNSTVVEMMRGFQGSAYDRGSIVANWAAFARADRCGEAEAAKDRDL